MPPLRRRLWPWVNRWVKHTFPAAPVITIQQLATWLSDGQLSPPILLDVRKAEEFAVSHLPQARQAPTLEAVMGMGLSQNQPIVAYCSIGYRSARLVEALQAASFTQVYNLEGSIFQWANAGYPIVCEDRPVAGVHPYNALWGQLLNPDLVQR
ncbi:MAG: rhodanese-like domain-containing protein [Nodosilinea sp.]